MRRWTGIGFSSIYWVLDRLVADGLAEIDEVQTDGRAGGRRVFRATTAGVRAWRQESLAVMADLGRPVEEFLIALSGLPGLDRAAARAALELRLAAIDAKLVEIRTAEAGARAGVPAHVDEMFAFGRVILEAQRAWLGGLLADRWVRAAGFEYAEMPANARVSPLSHSSH